MKFNSSIMFNRTNRTAKQVSVRWAYKWILDNDLVKCWERKC